MFETIRDFQDTWRHESTITAQVMERLTDDSLNRRVALGHRTLGELAWHMAVSHRSIMDRTGLSFEAPSKDMPPPTRAGEVVARYLAGAHALARAVETQWNDAALRTVDDVYGMAWPRGHTLFVLLCHEIHHRGQMTVLMRQAGLRVPAVYGPSGDER